MKKLSMIIICFIVALTTSLGLAKEHYNVFASTGNILKTEIRLHTAMIYLFRGSAAGVESFHDRVVGGRITDVTLRAHVTYSDGTFKDINLYGASGDNYSLGYDSYKFSYNTQISAAGGQFLVCVSDNRMDYLAFFTNYPSSVYLSLLKNAAPALGIDGKYLCFLDESEYTDNFPAITDIYFKADMTITNTAEGTITLTGLEVWSNDWDVLYTFPSSEDNYNDGYNDGYKDGYNNGYKIGYNAGISNTITPNWFISFIDSIFSIFNIEIFPNVRLIYLFFIPIGLGIVLLIFKLIRG